MKRFSALLIIIAGALQLTFAEPQFKLAIDSIGFTMSGGDLTKAGIHWTDNDFLEQMPMIPILMPTLTAKIEKAPPKEFSLISTNYSLTSNLSIIGISLGGELSLSLAHLLNFSLGSSIATSWNYGSTFESIGVYNPTKKDYDSCTSFTEFAYGFSGKVSGIIPLGLNMIQLSYGSSYDGFTGAENKEIWKCGSRSGIANGWSYNASIMFGHRFDYEKLKMISLITSMSGIYSDDAYAEVYQPYNPDFVTYSITPMLQFKLNEKQSLMINAIINTSRSFENNDYDKTEEFLQTFEKSKWSFKTLMFFWHVELK